MALDFPGFRFDQARAEVIARALRPLLDQAQDAGVPAQDQLAALALVAALVVSRTGLARDPDAAARALSALLVDAVRLGRLPT